MKALLISSLCLFAVSSWAAPTLYEVQMKISVDGKVISQPTINVEEGQLGQVVQTSNNSHSFVDFVARTSGASNIELEMDVGHIDSETKMKFFSHPKMLIQEGRKGEVSLVKGPTPEEGSRLNIEVKVDRIAL